MDAYLVLVYKNEDKQLEVLSSWASDANVALVAVSEFLMDQERDLDVAVGVFGQADVSVLQDLLNQTRQANL